ncbi:hypothetical protein LK414_04325 [Lachnospira eligens]|uniref:Stage V sporulation protein K n=1 Tax=Lachnospira eligens (strain ATCC 27750 / DSM 3376 / VPI C15-48 / C15-B4) TaxID=515620 RepID=C4Z4V6_LACE2|nr:hypothetical protein [Lachnospira eligens]ACR72995.1 Hypothetical protein EUBELI_02012 [[Eubacterium] eligens ATCC 27750]UEA97986.1 hypothetical protein LK414_04325 [Lachnospira eligens]
MNKYELGIKIDQIKKLAAKKDYAEAAAIAKELNWSKVKDWQSLATAINVQEAVGDYEEARDMAILAYNRNLGGRKLVYKLTEFFIKVGDFENANELYEEYSRTSQHDVSRFILLYDLKKAQNASDNELVGILEDYRDHEIDEKYMYELATLYYKTGRKEECVKTCDNIVLWFQDGRYVEKAVQLKEQLGVTLTKTQKGILEDVKKRKDDIEAAKEELFAKQKELIDLKRDDVEDVFREEDEKISELPKKAAQTPKEVHLNVPEYDRQQEEGPLSMDLVQNDQNNDIKEFIMKALSKNSDNSKSQLSEQEASVRKIETPQVEKPEVAEALSEAGEKAFSNEINKANLSLKELIANAKQKLDNNYDKINKEDEAEQRRETEARINEKAKNIDINVPVPDYSLYDTRNLQEELAANMSDLFRADEEDEDVKTFVPASKHQDEKQEEKEPVKENAMAVSVNTDTVDETEGTETSDDDQIEGQMDITEWMQSVREEKYGKQDTREFSKSELERYLDEKEEKSAAYEKMVERKKAEALVAGKEIDKEEAKQVALAQMAVDSARMDLAIRTGKAAARLEQEAAKAAAAVTKKAPVNAEEPSEEIPLVTAQIPTVSESMISDINSIMNDDNNKEEGDEAVAQQEAAAGVEPEETVPFTRQNRQPESMEEYNTDNDEVEEEKDKKLTGELAKIFRKYRDMPGLEEQLVDLFDTIDDEMQINTSKVGNILISGNSSSDKTDLARTIIRAINTLYPDKQKKIAKTSGESINQRGIAKAMGRLKGTALIVEGAGTIQPKRINELLNCLEQDTDRMIVIFEDSDTDMNVLINFNPELTNTFNHRIILKQYTVNELVEMAKRFARKRQYEVDDDALLELYLKIDKLHNVNDNIKLDDIKEIINQAIVNSERRASRRFFGGLKKKRSENGDVIFLTEADFKDR